MAGSLQIVWRIQEVHLRHHEPVKKQAPNNTSGTGMSLSESKFVADVGAISRSRPRLLLMIFGEHVLPH